MENFPHYALIPMMSIDSRSVTPPINEKKWLSKASPGQFMAELDCKSIDQVRALESHNWRDEILIFCCLEINPQWPRPVHPYRD